MKQLHRFCIIASVFVSSNAWCDILTVSSSDFAQLFNQYRVAQPKQIPWAGSYWGFPSHGLAVNGDQSPAVLFDKINGLNGASVTWENGKHSCDNITDAQSKIDCASWWGHCNGWSAAAIKEPEPLMPKIDASGAHWTPGTQKAVLSELWLDTGTQSIGRSSIASLSPVVNSSDPNYNTFWDVTPKQFFLTFTNYIGALRVGLAIDRFTGHEIWNQPIAGYRFLPLRSDELSKDESVNPPVYTAVLRVKFYYANDTVRPSIRSPHFHIANTSDDEQLELVKVGDQPAYVGRLLQFKLFFDQPVEVSGDGKKVLSAGHLVGDGIWSHQENLPQQIDKLNDSHPDFIWMPTALLSNRQFGNPYYTQDRVRKTLAALKTDPRFAGAHTSTSAIPDEDPPTDVTYALTVNSSDVKQKLGSDTSAGNAAAVFSNILNQAGLPAHIDAGDVTEDAGSNSFGFHVRMIVGTEADRIKSALENSDIPVQGDITRVP